MEILRIRFYPQRKQGIETGAAIALSGALGLTGSIPCFLRGLYLILIISIKQHINLIQIQIGMKQPKEKAGESYIKLSLP